LQENPPVSSTATGRATTTLNAAGTVVTVAGTFSGLTGNPTAAHIHTGAPRVNGGIICALTVTAATSGSVTGTCAAFTPAQIALLKRGQLYINIHTAMFPGGEVRGQIQRARATVMDYDGDAKTDYIVARNNGTNIEWWTLNAVGVSVPVLGRTSPTPSDFAAARFTPGDYDGDGKDDIALWRPGVGGGADVGFFILQSTNSTVRFEPFGQTGDDPSVVDDYDGDGIDDVAVYRPGSTTVNGRYFYRGSLANPQGNITFVTWGGGTPAGVGFEAPGDYDGDGRADYGVFRTENANANYYILRTSDGLLVRTWGLGSDFNTPGDYDGDAKTDLAINRGSTWFVENSTNGAVRQVVWGSTDRQRAQGDYDGDGKTDIAIWDPDTTNKANNYFWVLPSNGSPAIVQEWGKCTGPCDIAVGAYNSH